MKKTSYGIMIIILFATITYWGAGCNKKDDKPPPVEYTIKVDSIHFADTINAGDIFKVELYGKVGDNDCYAFKEIRDTIDAGSVTLELIGTHTFNENCNDGIIYMNPATASISGLTAGDWMLTITQPEGTSPIENEFFVKQ